MPTRTNPRTSNTVSPYNHAMDSMADILEDLRQGKMIVLVDDEARENEGDLVCAAEHVTPEVINFMVREGRGLLCLSLTGKRCDELDLHPQAKVNTAQLSTAFTVTVDGHPRFGVTTGVSASDRAATIQLCIDNATRPGDLVRPGHIMPLRARDGGVLVRAGQTEGSVDLARLAGLKPAAAIIEIMNDDGTMARGPDLEKLCKKHNLKMCSVADIVQYRLGREKLVHRLDEMPFETEFGTFRLIAYRSLVDPLPHVALVAGDLGRLDPTGQPIECKDPVLVRMHSQNLLGDVFADKSQNTSRSLHHAMREVQKAGAGAIVYLRHEKMGTGLLQRLQTSHLMQDEEATSERPSVGQSQATPGHKPPLNKGAYGIGCQILRDLGIQNMRLLTNHPFTPSALDGYGLSVSEFVPINV